MAKVTNREMYLGVLKDFATNSVGASEVKASQQEVLSFLEAGGDAVLSRHRIASTITAAMLFVAADPEMGLVFFTTALNMADQVGEIVDGIRNPQQEEVGV